MRKRAAKKALRRAQARTEKRRRKKFAPAGVLYLVKSQARANFFAELGRMQDTLASWWKFRNTNPVKWDLQDGRADYIRSFYKHISKLSYHREQHQPPTNATAQQF